MNLGAPLRGLFVPVVTPFTSAGALAVDALEKLAHDALVDGAAGLVALGTTGESAALTETEKQQVIAICSAACREREATLIVGTGTNDTRTTVEQVQVLEARGEADAVLVPTPYFTRPGEDGVVAHFAELSARSTLPVVVYNIPYRTGQALSATALRRLAALPNVIAVKQAVGGVDADTMDLLADVPDGFSVLVGDDMVASPMLAAGAHGGIVASSNLRTREFAELIDAWHHGDVARARTLGNELVRLSAALFAEPNPTVLKGVLHSLARIPTADVRLPLLPANAVSVQRTLSLCTETRLLAC